MAVRNISALSGLGVNPNVKTTTKYVPALSSLGVNPNVRSTRTTNEPVTRSGGGGSAPAPAPAPSRERFRPTRWDDASYYAQIAAIDRALRDFETGLSTRGRRYGEDYTRGLGDLGYRPGEGFIAAPDILSFKNLEEGLQAVRRPQIAQRMGAAAEGVEGAEAGPTPASEMLGGSWDYEGEYNPFSAATRGTRTARDEFAGRGTLRSSDFAQAYAEFQDRMNQQLEAMETGRGRFFEDALTNLAQQRATAEERRQAARRDAVMRAAMIDAGRR